MAIIKGDNHLRSVSGISRQEESNIIIYLQGAISIQTKKSGAEWFGLRDLMGGANFDWNNTPLYPLYLKHLTLKKNNPVKSAGKDCGWLLKKAIILDKRNFETKQFLFNRQYKLI